MLAVAVRLSGWAAETQCVAHLILLFCLFVAAWTDCGRCDRFARRVEPPAFARLDALHEKRPNLMRAATLIHSLNLSRNQVKLLNKHVQCHVEEAMLRARSVKRARFWLLGSQRFIHLSNPGHR